MDAALRVRAVAMAAASDLNDELTIIVNCAAEVLLEVEVDHPARALLIELRAAAARCTWKASGLLNYAARGGGLRATAASMERMMQEDLL